MPFNYVTPPADGATNWGSWLRTLLATLKSFVDGLETSKAATTHTHASTDLTDSTPTGRQVIQATTQLAARNAIGAGTSNVVIGTGAGQAADASVVATKIGSTGGGWTDIRKAATVSALPDPSTVGPTVLYVVLAP